MNFRRAMPWFILGMIFCVISMCVTAVPAGIRNSRPVITNPSTYDNGWEDTWQVPSDSDGGSWDDGSDSGSWDWGDGSDSGSWDDDSGSDSGSW